MLYHLSFDIFNEIKRFKPRIPKNRMKEEDCTTKRICFSKSIEGALLAIPDNKYFLNKSNEYFPLIKVYEIDENLINDSLLDSSQIADKVPDAFKTGECWITKPVAPTNSYIIQVTSVTVDNMSINKVSYDIIDTEGLDDYFNVDVEISLTEESLELLDDVYDDIDVDELFSELEYTLDSNINDIIEDTNVRSEISLNTLKLCIEGYFIGEFKRSFIFQEATLKSIIKESILKDIISKYKLNIKLI